jgi:hypothetical protein
MRRKTFVLGALSAAVVAALAFILFLGGEQNKGRSVGIAEAFLDAYYVSIDLEKARQLTGGLARSKIDRQVKAIRKMSRLDKNPSKVSYRLLNERSLGSHKKAFSFDLSIKPQDGRPFRRVVFLHLRLEERNWRVHAFREHNP